METKRNVVSRDVLWDLQMSARSPKFCNIPVCHCFHASFTCFFFCLTLTASNSILSALDSAPISLENIAISPVYYRLLLCINEKKTFWGLPFLNSNTLREIFQPFYGYHYLIFTLPGNVFPGLFRATTVLLTIL